MRLCVGGGHGCAPLKGASFGGGSRGDHDCMLLGVRWYRSLPSWISYAPYGGARTALRWSTRSGDKGFSADDFECNREERRLFYSKKGCCQAMIISSLLLKK